MMTLTIEVDGDKALEELKEFLEKKQEIRVVNSEDSISLQLKRGSSPEKEKLEEERRATLNSLYGSLNMSPERLKEYEAFLQEIRNEWE